MTELTSSDATLHVYRQLLTAWNQRDAAAFASLFSDSAVAIGFDGSQMIGRDEIQKQLTDVFVSHATGAYVAKVRTVDEIAPGVSRLHAVVGMVPAGKTALEPKLNAVQTIVTRADKGVTHIALLQNTSAAFHGRPELAEQLTAELSHPLEAGHVVS